MAKGFIHVNGTTCERAYPVQDIGQMVQRLQGAAPQMIDVRIDGQQVPLRVEPQRLWSSAAWLGSDE